MYSNRGIAKIVGVLFITVTVASSLCVWLTEPALKATDFLNVFNDIANQISLIKLLMLINAISVVFIAIMLFPFHKNHIKVKIRSFKLGLGPVKDFFFKPGMNDERFLDKLDKYIISE